MLGENILDERRLHTLQIALQSAGGRGASKISNEAFALLSEAIQLHAHNILDHCSTISRRRRHLSLISSYGYIVKSLSLGKGLPQPDTRSNLALKFGADAKTILSNEDLAVRTVLKDRTKAWEAEVLDSLKKEIEQKPAPSKKRALDNNGFCASDNRFALTVSNCNPKFQISLHNVMY